MANDDAGSQTGSQAEEKMPAPEQKREGIWLEVSEVRYEGGKDQVCTVLLKADHEHPSRIWWPVKSDAVRETPYETYKAILTEMDKKRMVLARLSYCTSGRAVWLRCDSFRFQAPELGSR